MPATPREPPQGDLNKLPILESVAGYDGGVRSHPEPYYLEETEAAYLKNINMDTPGLRKKRLGCQTIGGVLATPAGLGEYVDPDGTHQLAGVWGTDLYRSSGDYTWNKLNPTSSVSLADSFWHIKEGQGYVAIGAPAATILCPLLLAWGSEPYTNATYPQLQLINQLGSCATFISDVSPRAATWWQGRAWAGNWDKGRSNIGWSNLWDASTWDTAANNIDIDRDTGDQIMALVPTRGERPRLYIFKEHHIYALDVVWGSGVYIPETENSLDTTNSRLTLISEDKGCVAPKTVVYTSGSGQSDVFFLADDGYRSLRRVEQDVAGGAGEAISEPIRDVMDRINWSAASKAVAVVHDHKIFLSIPVDGSTSNNLTVVFDLIDKVWVSEYDWTVTDSVVQNLNEAGELMYYMYPHETTETLPSLGATSVNHVFQGLVSGVYHDPSLTAYAYEEQTKAFVYGDFGRKKRWDWLEMLMLPATSNITLLTYAKVDELEWALIDTADVAAIQDYPLLPAQLPWDFEQQLPQLYRLNLHELPPGQRIQFKFVTNTPASFGMRLLRSQATHYPEKWE
jgi:hypothetical protein